MTRHNRAVLATELVNDALPRITKAVEQALEDALEGLYERTFAHWGESGEDRFEVPKVKVEVSKVEARGVGLLVSVTSLAVRADGQTAHQLWYWLDQGTGGSDGMLVWDKPYPSAPFRNVESQRTYGGGLDPRPFQGYKEDFVRLMPGDTYRGIHANDWSDAIAKEFAHELSRRKGELAGLTGWRVTRHTFEMPNLKAVK